jgi:hypothetical protein
MAKSYLEVNAKDYEVTSLDAYDQTKFSISSQMTVVGSVIGKSFPESEFFGPNPIAISRVFELTGIGFTYPFVIVYDSNTHWVFLADIGSAAATRRIAFFEYKLDTNQYTYNGLITLTFPTTTAHTITGLRMALDRYSAGTASVSGTAVTGSDTLWQDSRLCVGNRIGFGSTDPTQITQWYEIEAIGSNTSITLTSSAGTIGSGEYVIEDLRAIVTTTNATTTNGGLFLAKGLRIELFALISTVIPSAVSTDNIRAVYWLKDAETIALTLARGVAIQEKVSWTEHSVYIINTGVRIFKYNIRAALTVASGASLNAVVAITTATGVTGTVSGSNNGRIAAPKHGPAADVDSLYFVTSSRIYRTALDTILDGQPTVLSNVMLEVPPGGTSTYPATNTLSAIEYDSAIDKFVVTSTGAAGARSYVTEFRTDSGPMDHIFLVDDKQYDQSLADSDAPVHPAVIASPFAPWSQSGVLHLVRSTSAALSNQMYAIPIGAHWRYANDTNQYIISPAISTSTATRFYSVYANTAKYLGSDTFSIPTEPYRIYYRTSGISDNSGSWTLIPRDGSLTSTSPASFIQFKFEFKIIGSFCIPARINGLLLTYEDSKSDSRYEASIAKSNISTNTFAWLQVLEWDVTPPNLRIRLFNSITRSLVSDDTINDSLYGTWEYSSDGTTWNEIDPLLSYEVGNYIRYSATSLPNGIKVSAVLQRA